MTQYYLVSLFVLASAGTNRQPSCAKGTRDAGSVLIIRIFKASSQSSGAANVAAFLSSVAILRKVSWKRLEELL